MGCTDCRQVAQAIDGLHTLDGMLKLQTGCTTAVPNVIYRSLFFTEGRCV